MIWIALVAVVFVAGGTWFIAKSMQTRLVVAGLGIAAVATYWFVGHPDMGDRPLDGRLAAIEQMIRTAPEKLDEKQAIAISEKRAREHPTEAMPHLMIARMYESLAQRSQAQGMQMMQSGDQKGAATEAAAMQDSLDKAQESFREALKRDPNNSEAISEFADLRFKTTGEVDETTTQLYQAAFQAQPEHYRLGYLAGIGLWKQGKKDEAEALWADIDKRAPAGGPERQMFAALRQMFGIDQPANPPPSP